MKQIGYRYRIHWWKFKRDEKKHPCEYSAWIYSEFRLSKSSSTEEQILYIDEAEDESRSSQENP
jgi:hypothetical protein